jgi:hypothetical protein
MEVGAARDLASPHARRANGRVWLAGLLLTAALGMGACAATPGDAAHAGATHTPTRIADPQARIHNVTPDNIPLFVRITFTDATTYAQAVAILESGPSGEGPDPWGCDDPRTPTPPPPNVQEAVYNASHTLLLSYPTWDELLWAASSPQVVSVDAATVYMCS